MHSDAWHCSAIPGPTRVQHTQSVHERAIQPGAGHGHTSQVKLVYGYVAPIVLKDHIPEIISSTQKKCRKSVERVPKQCRASLPGPDT
eukprot:508697-Pyramimonas_sp.AAC.1